MPDEHAQPASEAGSGAAVPATGTAQVHILQDGYAREDATGERVGSTVTLIIDGDVVVVVDPGMVSSRADLLAALASRGVAPEAVTDVVFSHHHPDHTVNAALFPAARIHDFWAVYDGDLWISREAEGSAAQPVDPADRDARPHRPGHQHGGLHRGRRIRLHARLVGGGRSGRRPVQPRSGGPGQSRQRILGIASVIIPGHGPSFVPGQDTPR